MEQYYIGKTPWYFGSVFLSIKETNNNYLKFEIYDTRFGVKWNSISFMITPNEYMNMINKKTNSMLITDFETKMHLVNYIDVQINKNGIVKFEISINNLYIKNYIYNIFGLDTIIISGLNFQLVETKENIIKQ